MDSTATGRMTSQPCSENPLSFYAGSSEDAIARWDPWYVDASDQHPPSPVKLSARARGWNASGEQGHSRNQHYVVASRPSRRAMRSGRSSFEWRHRCAVRYRCGHGERREEAPVEDRGPETVGVAQRHRRATHFGRGQRPDRERREGERARTARGPRAARGRRSRSHRSCTLRGRRRHASPTPPSKPLRRSRGFWNRTAANSIGDQTSQRACGREPVHRRCSAHASSAPMIAPGRRTQTNVPAHSTPASSPATSDMNARNAAAHARPHTAPTAVAIHGAGTRRAPSIRCGMAQASMRTDEQRRGVQADPECRVRSASGAVSDARTVISMAPRMARTPQVRRHRARPGRRGRIRPRARM